MQNQKIENIPIDTLIFSVNNSRMHSPGQINQIASSIKEFGFTNPVLIDEKLTILAGHGRVNAAKNLGFLKIPCLRINHLTEAQKKAYIIADNQIAQQAGWDEELLKLELGALADMKFDLNLLGFKTDELEGLLSQINKTGNETDEDDIPSAISEPITKLGDIWGLGDHKIICGNCTNAKDVKKLLNGSNPHLMVTDPPYGVNYQATWRQKIHGSGTDNLAIGKVLNDDVVDWSDAFRLFNGDVAYVWHAAIYTHITASSLLNCGMDLRALIVWAKNQLVISRGHYHHQYEPCWYAVKKGKNAHWQGSRKKSTLWKDIADIMHPGEEIYIRKNDAQIFYAISGNESMVWEIPKPLKSETGHSTQKPVECMRRPIQNNSRPGDIIYDPFLGSGSTLIAAEKMSRICYGIELNPAYVDIAVKRWETFTGKEAQIIERN